jgi:putative ABC transport system permease protein
MPRHLLPFLLLFRFFADEDVKETFLNYIAHKYEDLKARRGFIYANVFCLFQIVQMYVTLFLESTSWGGMMLRNYFKIAIRNLKKHKGYSFINIAGLAMGIACCIFILLYVQFELSYDNYHKDKDRIFRIVYENSSPTRGISHISLTAGGLASIIKENYPEVEYIVRIRGTTSLVKFGEKIFYEKDFMYTDQTIFNVFSIPLIAGDPSLALERPDTVIITENIAHRYFGNTDPVGNLLNIDGRDFTVTGIAENPPQNTILNYSMLGAMKTIADEDVMTEWNFLSCFTFMKLKDNVKPDDFEKKISTISHMYISDAAKKSGVKITHFLQPLTSIHLHSHTIGDTQPGNPAYLYIFSIVCVFILIIACINFINLTTARAIKRVKEIGMRKVIGANRSQLALHFLSDSCLISLLAFSLAIMIVGSFLRYFSTLVAIEFSLSYLFTPTMILTFAGLILFTGIAAGCYPALFLSSLKPAKIFKGVHTPGSGKSNMRRTLVVFQFAISIILIIVSIFIYKQIHFMKNKSLGFDKEHKLIFRVRGMEFLSKNFENIKNEFLTHSSISGATAMYYPPGFQSAEWEWGTTIETGGNSLTIQILPVDYDFINAYDIKIAAGRNFQREISTDAANAVLINKTAMKALGFNNPEEAVNKKLRRIGQGHDEIANELEIIGVTDDFHYFNLKSEILPALMLLHNRYFSVISLTLKAENLAETFSFVEKKWKELFPGKPLEYYYLDEHIDLQYRAEEQTGKIFGTFTLIGIFIACLGLYGLAAFTAEQRTKEIGIRKVLGASVPGVVSLLSREFAKWVLMANIIAWPAAYFFMKKWLENFAYRIDIGIGIFILSGLTALAISLLTVGFQTFKIAAANPVDSLRYE